jgi:hypothetical protein
VNIRFGTGGFGVNHAGPTYAPSTDHWYGRRRGDAD